MLYDLRDRGIDIRDLYRPGSGLTPRYVLWLVEHLPGDSALAASVRGGPQHRDWTSMTHLLAALVNMTYAANRQRGGQKTRTFPINPPKPKKQRRAGRVVRIANLPSARRTRRPPDSSGT